MRKFLVVLDDSTECLNAMRFAALRAARTGGGVAVLSVIPPEEFNHWIGVGDLMREEARERIEVHFEVFAKWMRDKQGVDPELIIREGEPTDEIIQQLSDDPDIGVLVLGAQRRPQERPRPACYAIVALRRGTACADHDRARRSQQGTARSDHLTAAHA